MTLIDSLRAEARAAPESGIVAVVNYGRLREGMIPLWAGEGDLPTPSFITAARSLRKFFRLEEERRLRKSSNEV